MPVQRGSLSTAINNFLNNLKIGERVKKSAMEFLDNLEDEAFEVNDEITETLGLRNNLPPALRKRSKEAFKQKRPAFLPIILAWAGAQLLGIIVAFLEPAKRTGLQLANHEIPNEIPDIPALLQLIRREPGQRPKWFDNARKQGFDADWVNDLLQATEQLANPTEILTLWRRKEITRERAISDLREQGWNDTHIGYLMKLTDLIPPVTDLIHFAVRDAFNDRAVTTFRLDEGFPEGIVKYAEAQGLSRDWMLKYWRSHWVLPSPQQAFEMFHRLRPGRTSVPFTSPDLDQYLLTADIPAFFRERMKEIAYNPLTRVDTRRMHDFGVLSEREVYESYLDLGYSPANAANLTRFTVVYNEGDTADISREAIIKAYKRGLFGVGDTITALNRVLGSSTVAAFWLQMANYDLLLEEQESIIASVKAQYIEGLIDRTTTSARLGQLNLPATQQNSLLVQWDIARENKVAIPSKADIEEWYKNGVASDSEARALLAERGYREPNISRFIRRMVQEIQKDQQKELERAQKEQERLAISAAATLFQKDLARFDVRIAEKKLAIANIKAALVTLEDEEDLTAMKQDLADLEVDIASITVEKARLRVER